MAAGSYFCHQLAPVEIRGSGFKSRSDDYLELYPGEPDEFNCSATLVNSQVACLLSVEIELNNSPEPEEWG